MTTRSIHETIEDLRRLLSEFEQRPDVGDCSASLAELNRLLRTRIAELESEFALTGRISHKMTLPIPR